MWVVRGLVRVGLGLWAHQLRVLVRGANGWVAGGRIFPSEDLGSKCGSWFLPPTNQRLRCLIWGSALTPPSPLITVFGGPGPLLPPVVVFNGPQFLSPSRDLH